MFLLKAYTSLNSTQIHLTELSTNINNMPQIEYPQIDKKIWEIGYENYFGQFVDDFGASRAWGSGTPSSTYDAPF